MAGNAGDFKARNVGRLLSAQDNLGKAVAEFEEICADLKPDSTLYVLILGQIVPKIQELIHNSRGKLGISDLLKLLNEADAIE